MRYIFVVIVLLSFIGIFINLSGASKTNEHKKHKVEKNEHVEFNLEPLPTDTPIELRENLPNEKVTSPAFDEMGNKISARGNGLKAGSLLINTRGKNGGVPTTRLGDFAGASALRIIDNDFGTPERIVTLKNSGLPFTAYAEYERDALLPVSAKDIENNPGPMRVAKEMATLGQVYMPEEDSVQEGTFRQPTLSHNKIDIKGPFLERTNKNEVAFLGNINREKLSERNQKIISRVMPETWEVSDKPRLLMVDAEKDRDLVKDRMNLRSDYIETLQKIGISDTIEKMTEKM